VYTSCQSCDQWFDVWTLVVKCWVAVCAWNLSHYWRQWHPAHSHRQRVQFWCTSLQCVWQWLQREAAVSCAGAVSHTCAFLAALHVETSCDVARRHHMSQPATQQPHTHTHTHATRTSHLRLAVVHLQVCTCCTPTGRLC